MVDFFKDMMLDLYDNFTEVFLSIIGMVVVLIVGFIISWFIKKLLARLLILFRFDKWANEVGIIGFLQKGGVKTLPSLVLSKIVYWIFIVVFFSFGLNFIGISQFSEYASRISAALPLIVVSIIIIIIGIILSNFIGRVIYLACENANLKYGDPIAKGVRIFLFVITFGIVFEVIGVGNTIITISFLIIFGGIIMTLSLALGIGLSNVVGELIKERLKASLEKKKE
ncbi:mechanosensitive ion channel family protein [Syntrophorhabdus aromaticivorans]|jgi:hypothetical protein|uniref:CmpX protein n=1 Tax=Syntrophorhabdus aromaticivorans TaxID=328301 RepID=A0A351U0D8_9BACT|nr:hypothetical protein [Syntrophorhabdus aromaticivorans]NLW35534.1 hypothetical protein [Syntrophorhabdus aromaticivorans]HBA53419.1 hypothetical protein [Syntrophorhabdus aromaticivorans]